MQFGTFLGSSGCLSSEWRPTVDFLLRNNDATWPITVAVDSLHDVEGRGAQEEAA
jgi:hypothetical protein